MHRTAGPIVVNTELRRYIIISSVCYIVIISMYIFHDNIYIYIYIIRYYYNNNNYRNVVERYLVVVDDGRPRQ